MAFKKSYVAKKYRDIHGMEMPTLKLARIMYNENNMLFKDVEDARSSLRYIENKAGKRGIKREEKYIVPERPRNPYGLPESHQELRDPFRLPKVCDNILLISDLHIPYHDINAITVALDYGVKQKVNTIYINGDLIDNHQVSKFEKRPKEKKCKRRI